jgi:hypothetical protein
MKKRCRRAVARRALNGRAPLSVFHYKEEGAEWNAQLFLKEEMMKNIVPVRALPDSPRRWKRFSKYKCNQKSGL